MKSFLYEILFPNGKKYFGITNNPSRRWSEHSSKARRGSKWPVHAAIRKYGVQTISFRVVKDGTRAEMMAAEIFAIAAGKTTDLAFGYNLELGGYLPSPETREKQRIKTKKRWEDPIYRERMTNLARNLIITPEARAKISAKLKGRVFSQQHLENMSKAQIGRKFSPERIAKMKMQFTTEVREKISAACRGKPAKNGVSDRNRQNAKLSPEQIAVIHLVPKQFLVSASLSFGVNGQYGHRIRKRRERTDWPHIVDRDAMRKTIGPLGEFMTEMDMDAAAYRFMRAEKSPQLPGVVFAYEQEARIA